MQASTISENRHDCLVTSFITAIFCVSQAFPHFIRGPPKSPKVAVTITPLLWWGHWGSVKWKDMPKTFQQFSGLCLITRSTVLLTWRQHSVMTLSRWKSTARPVIAKSREGMVFLVSSRCPGNEKMFKIIYKLNFFLIFKKSDLIIQHYEDLHSDFRWTFAP